MKFIVTILLLSYLSSFSVVNAQSFKVLYSPKKYLVPEDGVSLSETTEVISGSYWEVFSDKANNQTYKNSKGKQAFKKLAFLEKFYVIGEEENYVRIAKGKTGNYINDITTSGDLIGGEDYGWILKEDLLLWKSSIRTKDKILKKAMLLNAVSALKVRVIGPKIKFYSSPKLNTTLPNSQNLFDFFYVFKETNKAVLLGDKDRLTFSQSDIFGWVAKDKITSWNHRLAVEPIPNTNLKIYETKKDAIDNSAKPILNIQTQNERKIGTWRRFPIIDKDSINKVLKIAAMGGVYTGSNEYLWDADKQAYVEKVISQGLRAKRKINLVFVIDGTKSMENYFNSIASAIENSMAQLQGQTENEFRFAAVIYTDEEEGPDYLTRVIRLDNNYRLVANWIRNTNIRHQKNTSIPEAVYCGLNEGLQGSGLSNSTDETNILVLVGDAGNREGNNCSSLNQIAQNMANKDIHFLAFQVHNEQDESYDDFSSQANNLIKKTTQIVKKRNQNKGITLPDLIWDTEVIDRNTRNVAKNGSNIYSLLIADKNKAIAPYQLGIEIKEMVASINNYTNNFVKQVQSKALGKTIGMGSSNSQEYVDDFEPAILNFLVQKGFNPNDIHNILEDNRQFYTEAYVKYQQGNTATLINSLLFTREELGTLIHYFSLVEKASTNTNRRESLKTAWMKILKDHLGDKYSVEEMMEKYLDEAHEMVIGLPSKSKFLHVKIKDITIPSMIPDTKVEEYINLIIASKNNIRPFYNDKDYKYGFYSDKTPYYWILNDDLP